MEYRDMADGSQTIIECVGFERYGAFFIRVELTPVTKPPILPGASWTAAVSIFRGDETKPCHKHTINVVGDGQLEAFPAAFSTAKELIRLDSHLFK